MVKVVKHLYSFSNSPINIIHYDNGEYKIMINQPLMLSREYFKKINAIAYSAISFYVVVQKLNQAGYHFLRISYDGTVTPIGKTLSTLEGTITQAGNRTDISFREFDYLFPDPVYIASNTIREENNIPESIASNSATAWKEASGTSFFFEPDLSASTVFNPNNLSTSNVEDFIYDEKKSHWLNRKREPFSIGWRGWRLVDISFDLGWFIVQIKKIYFLYHFSRSLPILGPSKHMEFKNESQRHCVLSTHDITTDLYKLYSLLADTTYRAYVEEDDFPFDDPKATVFPAPVSNNKLSFCKDNIYVVTIEQAEFMEFMCNTKIKETTQQQQSAFQQILKESTLLWSDEFGFVHGFDLKNENSSKTCLQFEKRLSTNVGLFSIGKALYLRYVGSAYSFSEKQVEFIGGCIADFNKDTGLLYLYFGDEILQIALEKLQVESIEEDIDGSGDVSVTENVQDEYGIEAKENAIVVQHHNKVILDNGTIITMSDILDDVNNWIFH